MNTADDDLSKLSPAQLLMYQDGLPLACMLPRDPHRPFEPPAKRVPLRLVTETFQPEKEMIKPRKKRDKEYPKQDLHGMRWCPRRNKFVVDQFTTTSSRESEMKKKWKITCYDAANEVIARGSTSVPEDTGQVELFAKMGAAYHRCAADTVHKVIVTNDADERIREWEKGQNAEFPVPDPEAKPAPKKLADTKKKVAAKPAKKSAAKAKAKAPEKPAKKGAAKAGGIKKVGVIATIVELMSRKNGASIPEIVEGLMEKFPDRDEKGMTSTARIQANKHQKSKEKDDSRGGMVYYAK